MTRSNAREVAVHLIYEIDYTGEDPARPSRPAWTAAITAAFLRRTTSMQSAQQKQMDYIRTCVTGVCEHAEELDALIAQYAVRWICTGSPA